MRANFRNFFLAIDAVWLRLARPLYVKELGTLLRGRPNFIAASLFYCTYIIGVEIFVLLPALQANSWLQACGLGAFFGAVAYATYDLTNLATLKNWSAKLTAIDIAWGAFVTATAAMVTFFIMQG